MVRMSVDKTQIKVVSFDCAQTLLDVHWVPAEFAVECAKQIGLNLDEQVAGETYNRMLQTQYQGYILLNQERNAAAADQFWRELGRDWLCRMGHEDRLEELLIKADELMFGPNSIVFKLYPDTIPCLDEVKRRGYRMIVLSNWDISLHKVLRSFGLSDYFEAVFASMEHGCEKPDPRFFQVAIDHCQVSPGEFLHIGDNPLDDLMGAKKAGMNALVIDRSLDESMNWNLARLTDLPAWLDQK